MTTPPEQPTPGWYPDPGGSPSRRWWDGTQWTAATRPQGHPAGDAEPGPDDLSQAGPRPGWRSLGGLSIAVAILLGINALLAGAAAVAFLGRVKVVDDFLADAVTLDEVSASDERVALSLGLTMLALLVAAIVWLVWFAFAAHNAATLGKVRRGAVWGWFVPIVSLFRPKQVANDIHRAAGDAHPPAVTQFWWGTWVLSALLSTAAFNVNQRANVEDDLEGLQLAARLWAASMAFMAIAAVLAIVVCRRLTRRLEERGG